MVLKTIRGDSLDDSSSVVQSDIQRLLYFYIMVLLTYLLVVQMAIPIFMTDTDIWYHLNGGRYFWTAGQVPNFSFFSFLEPPREWINYFWGFQAVVYQIYDLGGYLGLVLFRSLLCVFTVGLILAFVFAERRARENPTLFLVLAVVMVVIVLARSFAVRPHMVSYLCIVLTIYILQYRTKLAPLLPLVTVLWSNLHGIELVVNALICGAYLIEHAYTHWRKELPFRGLDIRYVVSILACSLLWLLTPYGMQLAHAPFAHDSDIYLFINELRSVEPSVIYAFVFSFVELNVSGAVTILASIEVVGVIVLAVRRQLRLSHIILALGGIVLLFKGVRFIWEWALLTLPLAHAVLLEIVSVKKSASRFSLSRLLVAGYFVAMPFASTYEYFSAYDKHPFEPKGLPVGTALFLESANARGNLLAHPNYAGYFQWALYPDILIYSDMEFPPFRGFDMYAAKSAAHNTHVLGRLLKKSNIDFIAIHLTSNAFAELIAEYEQFAPVFFDDTHILYANRNSQADLVTRFELKFLDPYDLKKGKGDYEQRISELTRIVQVYPESHRAHHALVWLSIDQGRYEEALIHAKRFVDLYPRDPNANYLIGNVLETMGRCEDASLYYKSASEYADNAFAKTVQTRLGSCAYLQKKFAESYSWFSKGVNPYIKSESPTELYQYAYSAAVVGDIEKAINILDIILVSVDPADKSMIIKAKTFRDDLSDEAQSDVGVFSWLRSLTQ